MDPPAYSNLSSDSDITYLRNILEDQDNNLHHDRELRFLVMRNSDVEGKLLDLKLPKHKFTQVAPWVLIRIRDFKENKQKYEIPVCMSCSPELMDFSEEQRYSQVAPHVCVHSRVAGHIVRSFKNPYYLNNWLELSPDEDDEKEIKTKILLRKEKPGTSTQNLSVVIDREKFFLLYTVGKQSTPTCSGCSGRNCKHVRIWKKAFDLDVNVETQPRNNIVNDDHDDDDEENEAPEPAHYDDQDIKYGHNNQDFIFPIQKSPEQKAILEARNAPGYCFPSELVPEYSENIRCGCGKNNLFQESVFLVKTYVTVFDERGEHRHQCNLYARKSAGGCKCEFHYDGAPIMMYHIREGKFIDYVTLNSFIIQYVNCGITTYGFHKSIRDNCRAIGSQFSITYEAFNQACDGFVYLMNYDEEEAYSCSNCGLSPEFFVGDGKMDCAPLRRKLNDLGVKEFGPSEKDKNILRQGSKNADRLFIARKKERDFISSFLTGSINIQEFLEKSEAVLVSDNSKKIIDIVRRFSEKENLPESYVAFLAEITKNSPVAGFLQVTDRRALYLLREYCLRNVNLREISNLEDMKLVQRQLPIMWGMILNISREENNIWLPRDISAVITELLKIRHETFNNTPTRYSSDYVPYTESRDPNTEYYPNHKLFRYPKQYLVSNQKDRDFCEKNFEGSSDFCPGIFSIGEFLI